MEWKYEIEWICNKHQELPRSLIAPYLWLEKWVQLGHTSRTKANIRPAGDATGWPEERMRRADCATPSDTHRGRTRAAQGWTCTTGLPAAAETQWHRAGSVRLLCNWSTDQPHGLPSCLLTWQDMVLLNVRLLHYLHIVTGMNFKLCMYCVNEQNLPGPFFLPKDILVRLCNAFLGCYLSLQVPRNINAVLDWYWDSWVYNWLQLEGKHNYFLTVGFS